MKLGFLIASLATGFALQSNAQTRDYRDGRYDNVREVHMMPGQTYLTMDPQTRDQVRLVCVGEPPISRPPDSRPPNHVGYEVEYYTSDSCSSSLVAIGKPWQSCEELAASSREKVWAVKVNGTCMDINDTTILSACYRFRAAGQLDTTTLYKSDYCSSEAVATVNRRTDCKELADRSGNSAIWGVKKADGTCLDITDTDLFSACSRFK